MFAQTPLPPYYAVIFTSVRNENDDLGYETTLKKMENLASKQPGFLGVESARSEVGITVSYWESLEVIQNWKENLEHRKAIAKGKKIWYHSFRIRVVKVEKEIISG